LRVCMFACIYFSINRRVSLERVEPWRRGKPGKAIHSLGICVSMTSTQISGI
jgi:hypothetical protein